MTKRDFKLYGSLILYALLPSVYLLIRMQIVAVNGVNINIMGQIEWFDLIDEVLVTALTVPLYFLLKPDNGKTAPKKNCAAFLVSIAVYAVCNAENWKHREIHECRKCSTVPVYTGIVNACGICRNVHGDGIYA